MENTVIIHEAGIEDIPTIQSLAHLVWPATYGNLMSANKLEYMLQLIYSAESLRQQMQQGHHFLLASIHKTAVGFASYSATKEVAVYKLQKLYVRTDIQGRGLGKALINHVIDRIQPLQASALLLNVKRDNTAVAFYEKMGFAVVREEDIDIGNGYFMNDYVMEKKV